MAKNIKGTTRLVIDIQWENVQPPYGHADGNYDCGTVMSVMDLLDKVIAEKKLQSSYNGHIVVANSATIISYVTNVSHPTTPISFGAALHPVLRASNGAVKN